MPESKIPYPDHSVLAQPWTYELIELLYRRNPSGVRDDTLHLTLAKSDRTVRLLFRGVQEFQIDSGFPCTVGLMILDISENQWEGLSVEVGSYENSGGVPRFYARSVEQVT